MRRYLFDRDRLKKKTLMAALFWFFVLCLFLAWQSEGDPTGKDLLSVGVVYVVIGLKLLIEAMRTAHDIFVDETTVVIRYVLKRTEITVRINDILRVVSIPHSLRDRSNDGGVRIETKAGNSNIYWLYLKNSEQLKRQLNLVSPIIPGEV